MTATVGPPRLEAPIYRPVGTTVAAPGVTPWGPVGVAETGIAAAGGGGGRRV